MRHPDPAAPPVRQRKSADPLTRWCSPPALLRHPGAGKTAAPADTPDPTADTPRRSSQYPTAKRSDRPSVPDTHPQPAQDPHPDSSDGEPVGWRDDPTPRSSTALDHSSLRSPGANAALAPRPSPRSSAHANTHALSHSTAPAASGAPPDPADRSQTGADVASPACPSTHARMMRTDARSHLP